MWPWLEGLGKKVGFILIAAMNEVFVESPFPQFTPSVGGCVVNQAGCLDCKCLNGGRANYRSKTPSPNDGLCWQAFERLASERKTGEKQGCFSDFGEPNPMNLRLLFPFYGHDVTMLIDRIPADVRFGDTAAVDGLKRGTRCLRCRTNRVGRESGTPRTAILPATIISDGQTC